MFHTMGITRRDYGLKSAIVVALVSFSLINVEAVRIVGGTAAEFDVTKFGAKGDGKPQHSEDGESLVGLAFVQAWQKACNSLGPSRVLIPKGTFAIAQVLFSGPCQSQVTVELQGDIIADPDVTQFPNNELLVFQQVEGATFTGAGTINVNRPKAPPVDPEKEIVFMDIMPSITLSNVTNFVMDGIHSMNPAAFHVLVDSSHNVSILNSNFEAATVAPNTHSNGIYISSTAVVTVSNTKIKTGDDCITVSGGSSDVIITGVTCLGGQGISIGAQLTSTPSADIKGVNVKNCIFRGAAFGARINPRPHEKPGQISAVSFEGLTMDGTQNPISIFTDFPPKPNKPNYAKITDVHFKNIKGSTTTDKAVSFSCNKASPCDAVDVADVTLTFTGKGPGLSAVCTNAKVTFTGKHDGLNCA